jgi:hypothetical protein
MVPVLRAAVPRLEGVEIVVIDERGAEGGRGDGDGVARSAEPGNPAVEFCNV